MTATKRKQKISPGGNGIKTNHNFFRENDNKFLFSGAHVRVCDKFKYEVH